MYHIMNIELPHQQGLKIYQELQHHIISSQLLVLTKGSFSWLSYQLDGYYCFSLVNDKPLHCHTNTSHQIIAMIV